MVSPVLSNYLLLETPKGPWGSSREGQSGWPTGRSLSGPAVPSQPTEKCGGERSGSGLSPGCEVFVQRLTAESQPWVLVKGAS